MNWKVRFRNKVWLASFIAVVVEFVYQILAAFDVVPAITEASVMQGVNIILMLLSGLGVLIDPTTEGISDSKLAMSYEEPHCDK